MTPATLDRRGVLTACPSCGKMNRVLYESLAATPRCGHCKTALSVPGGPVDVPDAAAFQALVARSAIPVVVDFWAPWCGPCLMMAPELEKVAWRQAGEWLVVKVNTEALQALGQQYRIRSIPTIAVFSGGEEVSREAGARPADQIVAFVARHVRSTSAAGR